MIGQRLAHYQILEKLGEGGMGVVYKGVDTRLGRPVAIKVVNAEFTQRFEREARAISALNHPHICTLYDVGEHEGAPYLVMEYVEGKPLEGPLPAAQALTYAIQVGEALAAAHKAGIVHRDLKPDNILLTKEGKVKVLDFGLAKLQPGAAAGSESVTVTERGVITGTASYMSPEQARGEAVDGRSDIFSLGAVLYELLSGRKAFRREGMVATLAAVMMTEQAPLKDAPAAAGRVVRKMLEKKREDRYQSAEELLVGLRAAATGAAQARRRLVLALAASIVLLLALAVGFDVRGLRTRLVAWMQVPTPSIRLAVLPFANLSGDPEQEYLSDGITQEMITQLGKLHPGTLSVIARTSVMRYKQATPPIDQVGRELNVDYVLEGSARREGGRVRITAELITVRGQAQMWADSYEREVAGILAVQSEVAQQVARSLTLRLLPAEQARLANVRQVNPEAYDAYLKGLHHWYKVTPGELDSAEQYYKLALTKDPNYAAAYAGIAGVWAGRQQMGYTPVAEAAPKARAAARKAVELNPDDSSAHHALAITLAWSDWEWNAAEKEFRRALELDPNSPDVHAYYSHLLAHLGRTTEALAQMERALELDPLNPLLHALYGVVLNYARRYDDAVAQFRKTLQAEPGHPIAQAVIADSFFMKGTYQEAAAAMRTYLTNTYPGIALGQLPGQIGSRREYASVMKQFGDVLLSYSRKAYVLPSDVVVVSAHAGDKLRTLEWLEKGVELRDPNMPYIGVPSNDSLRSEPRFQAVMRRMNLAP